MNSSQSKELMLLMGLEIVTPSGKYKILHKKGQNSWSIPNQDGAKGT